MKTLFILNSYAGSSDRTAPVIKMIRDHIERHKDESIEIHPTVSKGDAEYYSDKWCNDNSVEDSLRVFACGGDGTVNDVLNGLMGHPNAALGIIPIGTGNDFCRSLPDAGDFMDIDAQLAGGILECDTIRYSGIIDGRLSVRYCLNMFNIGFDCNVVDMTAKVKRSRFISGSLAYLVSVLIILIRKKGADLRIELDGKVFQDGKLLLTSIANGGYCGGGVNSNPLAFVCDGLIDVNIVHNVSRIKFIRLFPSYQKGEHINIKGIEKTVEPHKCRRAVVTPLGGTMRLCTDGEITDAETVTFDIMPKSIRIIIPKKDNIII
ncbi:MAG: YegS/Rv2252/BmrU family lipid kinase [Clostridiales bacterium]|nr:YegS/Rv2252/BmrU family lipid kinase [Clostridiales bacterium]